MSSRIPVLVAAAVLGTIAIAVAGGLVAFGLPAGLAAASPLIAPSGLAAGSIAPTSNPAHLGAGPGAVRAAATTPGGTGGTPAPGGAPVTTSGPAATSGPAGSPSPGGSSPGGSSPSATPVAPTVAPSATPPASPSPSPSPVLVRAPLTGVMVPPAVASQHVIAVMIDDLSPARPQSGLSAASVIWQAPAEGGIPRYMLLFQDQVPADVGPVRSARYYFIAWAAEWRAAFAHAGGSPQALAALRSQGRGQLVYNVDQFAYGNAYFWRITTKYAPHNLYTNGQRLGQLATAVGARSADEPPAPAWTFGRALSLVDRPTGGSIEAWYTANHIRYTYDRATNTYARWVSPGVKQVDASTGERVAPTNVVIMFVKFGALADKHPEKGRLEAEFVGSGNAYVATNGKTVKARWVKSSVTEPTRFVDADGRAIALTPGQTIVQVMPVGAHVVIADGKAPTKRSSAGHSSRPN